MVYFVNLFGYMTLSKSTAKKISFTDWLGLSIEMDEKKERVKNKM